MSVKIEARDLCDRLDDLSLDQINRVLIDACVIVEANAKDKCPVDSGELRQSIKWRVDDLKGIVSTNKFYAPYVEYGTGIWAENGQGRQDRWSYQDAAGEWHSTIGQKPQPFMRPALNEAKDTIVQLFVQEIQKNDKH